MPLATPASRLGALAVLSAGFAGCASVRAADPAAVLAGVKQEIMTADYRGDVPGLVRLRRSVAPLEGDPDVGHLARYWAGFASWRAAINGANRGANRDELKALLERARADFERAIAAREAFADAHAAAAGVAGWLAAFEAKEAAVRAVVERAAAFLARAKALEPDNPRVLWVEAAPYLFSPPGRGRDPERAIGLYRRMLEVAGPPAPGSPLPDWGRPEAWMSLAFAHAGLPTPDLALAEREARAALALRPDWSYVKDQLLPQIEEARGAR